MRCHGRTRVCGQGVDSYTGTSKHMRYTAYTRTHKHTHTRHSVHTCP